MWHEARRQEKKIKCLLVDYQRRAQRRKDYYEKIKADPTQFLQLHGRPCKIHLDPAVALAANSPATMMPWQGNTEIVIDRFDARAHLDYVPEIKVEEKIESTLEERHLNYERYRILVQNDFFGITENKFLHQINLEEKYGPTTKAPVVDNKKTAAIAYKYEDDQPPLPQKDETVQLVDINNSDDSDSEIDLDLSVDVSKIETQQANELNMLAHPYGMHTNDFFSFLNHDVEEVEALRLAREKEEEKAMFSGRRSRKERREYRERSLAGRKISPPSYAWKKSPLNEEYKTLIESKSKSKSLSPVNAGKITYITSFGDEEPTTPASKWAKIGSPKRRVTRIARSRSRSRRRSRSRSRPRDALRSKSRYSSTKERKIDNSRNSKSSPKPKEHNKDGPSSSQLPRYYGRRKDGSSSSDLTLTDDEAKASKNTITVKSTPQLKTSSGYGSTNSATKVSGSGSTKLTPQERLRRKRQVLLSKQYKADKRAEQEKVMKIVQERIDREEEMKEISIKLRRRQQKQKGDGSDRRTSSSSSTDRSSRSSSRSDFSRSRSRSSSKSRRYRYRRSSSSDSGSSRGRYRERRRRDESGDGRRMTDFVGSSRQVRRVRNPEAGSSSHIEWDERRYVTYNRDASGNQDSHRSYRRYDDRRYDR